MKLTNFDKNFLLKCGIDPDDKPQIKPEISAPKSSMVSAKERLREEGCTCFLGHPPCAFCVTFDPDTGEEWNRDEGDQL